MSTVLSRSITTAVAAVALAAPLALASPAVAESGGHPSVRSSGACSGGGTFELKAKHDDGRIEVEYEVDTNRAGQAWHVRLTDNGRTVFSGTRTTKAPSGSFTIHRSVANRAGSDTIRAKATFDTRSCGGKVTL